MDNVLIKAFLQEQAKIFDLHKIGDYDLFIKTAVKFGVAIGADQDKIVAAIFDTALDEVVREKVTN